MNEIKAVLFDLGDTLVNFGKVSTTKLVLQGARSSYDYLKSQGQPVGSFAGYFLRYLVRLRIRYFLSEYRGKDFDSLALLERAGRKEGLTCSRAEWEQVIWRWYEPLSKLAELEDDLEKTLTDLQTMGLKLGIVSNTFVNRASLEKHLEQLGIRDFFPLRLYSYELGLRKPDRRIFEIAAERIGEAPPNILFVGDRIDKDIVPALDAGMKAALKDAYTNVAKDTPAGAWRIGRIAELPGLIERAKSEVARTSPA
ncbi:MAG: HAD family hydrolase [Phycisphaerales bacterium]|nr:MAG: HAD family hydrolase [Phycisphaerales bacterium]